MCGGWATDGLVWIVGVFGGRIETASVGWECGWACVRVFTPETLRARVFFRAEMFSATTPGNAGIVAVVVLNCCSH